MLIKDEKGRFPNTTCHVCKRTRQQDYTVMVNLSTKEHPFLVDICNDCAGKPQPIERDANGNIKIFTATDRCTNDITFRDADGTPSTFEVKDGIIRDIVEAK